MIRLAVDIEKTESRVDKCVRSWVLGRVRNAEGLVEASDGVVKPASLLRLISLGNKSICCRREGGEGGGIGAQRLEHLVLEALAVTILSSKAIFFEQLLRDGAAVGL